MLSKCSLFFPKAAVQQPWSDSNTHWGSLIYFLWRCYVCAKWWAELDIITRDSGQIIWSNGDEVLKENQTPMTPRGQGQVCHITASAAGDRVPTHQPIRSQTSRKLWLTLRETHPMQHNACLMCFFVTTLNTKQSISQFINMHFK